MMTVARIVCIPPIGEVEGSGSAYHELSISSGRQVDSEVLGAEYAIDSQPVSAETFRDVLALLALPSGLP